MRIADVFMKFKNVITARNKQGRLSVFDSPGFYLISAFLCELLIEILSNHSILKAFKFLIFNPFAFFFNVAIIYISFSLCYFIPKRTFAFALISVVWLGLGVANFVIQFKRVTPLTVVDFTLIPSVFKIFSVYLSILEIILICLLVLAVVGLLALGAIKLKSYKIEIKKGIIAFMSTALVIVLCFKLGIWTSALSNDFYNISIAYSSYGFPYCFIIGAFDRGISKPDKYNKDVINQIKSELDSFQDTAPEDKPNIVFVQLESFFDVNYLNFIDYSENPVPNFQRLKKEGISGFLTVPSIGAGTVNTEFEVLSGMSLDYFGAGEYPYQTVLKKHTCESVAYNLHELGYSTHAIHNYEGSFYNRNLVYPYLGFQTFTSLEYMNNVKYNESGKWPDDSILTDEIIGALQSTRTSDFIMAVSVQGHGIYPPSELSDGYRESISVTLDGDYKDKTEAYSYYINQIAQMDEFIGELVTAINNFNEDTVIVMYGDHLPTLGIEDTQLSSGSVFTTEYLILSNFGLEDEGSEIGDLSTYQLSANVLELLGISNGNLTKLHQNFSDSDDYETWIHDLCYDMLYGKRYVYSGDYSYYPIFDMKMGYKEITIDSYTINNGIITVKGTNFTPFSVIMIDGKTYNSTHFVSENEICVYYGKESFEALNVAQYSATGALLSSCKELQYVSE